MALFSNLQHSPLPETIDKQDLYLLSETLLDAESSYYFDLPLCLEENLTEGTPYYVIHDHVLHKGKLRIQLGSAVIAEKQAIIGFVQQELERNDLTILRIMPVSDKPDLLIYFTEDDGGFVYGGE